MGIFTDAGMFVRVAMGLKPFVQTVSLDDCRALLHWAGLEVADVSDLVRKEGIEKTLELLQKAQVYVTIDEFKGHKPIRRNGLELVVRPEDFDSPLATRHFEAHTGGIHGTQRRIGIDLDSWNHDTAAQCLFMQGYGVLRVLPAYPGCFS